MVRPLCLGGHAIEKRRQPLPLCLGLAARHEHSATDSDEGEQQNHFSAPHAFWVGAHLTSPLVSEAKDAHLTFPKLTDHNDEVLHLKIRSSVFLEQGGVVVVDEHF